MVPDLSTSYLGMKLKNPLVPSASPLARDLDTPRRLEDAGAAAIVMDSLFEEQVVHDMAELDAVSRKPIGAGEESRSAEYLERLYHLKEELSIPVIASLNCDSTGAWVRFAAMFEEAGADALELNVYYVAASTRHSGATVEARYLSLLIELRRAVSLPIVMKLSPHFSSLPHFVQQLEHAGAQGVRVRDHL